MRPVEIQKPRFEFRSFGKDFSLQAKKMKRLSEPITKNMRIRRSKEVYIISITNDINSECESINLSAISFPICPICFK